MPVARIAGGALCAVRGYRAERAGGGPTVTGINQLQARARASDPEFLKHHASPMPLSQERHHKHTINHKSHSQRGPRGPGTLCPSAPLAKPRPPAESPQTAQSSQHCLMLRCRSLALIRPSQKRAHYTLQLQVTSGLIRHHSTQQLPLSCSYHLGMDP